MDWSFAFGRLFGIPIRVHWALVLVGAFWVLRETTPQAMGWKLAVCAVFVVSVLVHEMGHCFAARGVGGRAQSILLWPLGGLAYTSHGGRLVDDIKVVLGGPLTHIPLAALFARLLTFQGVPWDWSYLHPFTGWTTPVVSFWTYLFLYGLKIQVLLFLFNLLLPVYPLDGGRLLANLMRFRFSRETTANVLMVLSAIFALLIAGTYSLLIGLMVLFETYQLWQFRQQGALSEHPLFARITDGYTGRSKSTGSGVVLPFRKPEAKKVAPTTGGKQKLCPYCQRSLPVEAKMCGLCEKMLPPI